MTDHQWDFEALYTLSRMLHDQRLDKSLILQKMLTTIGDIFDATYGCVVTFKDDDTIEEAFVLDIGNQLKEDFWQTLVTHGLLGFVYHSRRTVNVHSIASDPRWSFVRSGPKDGSAIGVPLKNDFNVFGALILMHPAVEYFTQSDIHMLEEVASLASIAITNATNFNAAQTGDTRYEHLFDGSVVPMLLTSLDGTILEVNPKMCDFLDYSRKQLLNQPISVVHGISDSLMLNGKLEGVTFEQEHSYNTLAIKQDRAEIPVSVRARRLRLRGRELVEWVLHDATTQMELEQLRGDLSAMVYHDLRGPLHTINGSINKLGKVLANHENPAVLTLLQIGIQSTRQLRRLVDSLLDIRRLEEGKAILDQQPMELRVLLADAVQLVQPIALESGQKIRFNLDNNLPMVMIDGDMMVRVVINLLENASKYTPDDGEIILSARLAESDNGAEKHVLITIADSGPGIPHNMQQRIFDKFNRVKYKDAPRGIGLGLAFCRLAIEAHGGTIWVESEPGNGAKFIFTLPLEIMPHTTDSSEVATV